MLRKVRIVAAFALLSSTALAPPAFGGTDDVASALSEVKASAVTTRALAAGGFTSHGSLENEGGSVIDHEYDGAGHTRRTSPASPGEVTYGSTGVGSWGTIAPTLLRDYGAGLAYIGKSDARYFFVADPAYRADRSEAAEIAEDLGRRRFTFLSVDRSGTSPANTTYAFSGYIDVPTQLTTMTVQLSGGVVTRFNWHTPIAGEDDLEFERTWSYGPQEVIALPTETETTTMKDMVDARSAVVLKSTVRAHAREVGVTARKAAKRAGRTTVTVADVRTAAAHIVEHYQETPGHPEDALPTRSVNLTGGVALHATDRFKNKVRIATVQAVKGKVVVSL
jgi:hypothetical protein